MENRISNLTLQQLCIKNNWFTCGDNEQYDALFEANRTGAPLEQIATIIWICSDMKKWCRRDIIFELNAAGFTSRCEKSEKEHLLDWLGI